MHHCWDIENHLYVLNRNWRECHGRNQIGDKAGLGKMMVAYDGPSFDPPSVGTIPILRMSCCKQTMLLSLYDVIPGQCGDSSIDQERVTGGYLAVACHLQQNHHDFVW